MQQLYKAIDLINLYISARAGRAEEHSVVYNIVQWWLTNICTFNQILLTFYLDYMSSLFYLLTFSQTFLPSLRPDITDVICPDMSSGNCPPYTLTSKKCIGSNNISIIADYVCINPSGPFGQTLVGNESMLWKGVWILIADPGWYTAGHVSESIPIAGAGGSAVHMARHKALTDSLD